MEKASGLVLTRRVGEAVIVTDLKTGRRLKVQPTMIDRGKVRLLFIGDEDFQVNRIEIQAAMDAGKPPEKRL